MATSSQVCKFNQTGLCKFSDKCMKRHVNEMCSNRNCSDKLCTYRHPRACKYFNNYRRCKFGNQCAYYHHPLEENVLSRLEERMATLEENMRQLVTKVEALDVGSRIEILETSHTKLESSLENVDATVTEIG